MNRVGTPERATVRRILRIILAASRPLAIGEMALALALEKTDKIDSLSNVQIDPNLLRDRICSWCGRFIFINHSRIYLIHQTAKEFLVRSEIVVGTLTGCRHSFPLGDAEKEMT